MTTHALKTIQPYFNEVWEGRKTFEFRKDDRGFAIGDQVMLYEYDPETLSYIGRIIHADICYILRDFEGISEGYCVLSLTNVMKFSVKKTLIAVLSASIVS